MAITKQSWSTIAFISKVLEKLTNIGIYMFLSIKQRELWNCQSIWKKIENELFQGLLVKMVSDRGLVVSETDLTV